MIDEESVTVSRMWLYLLSLTSASHPSCSSELPPPQSLWALCRLLSGDMFWETSVLQWALLRGLCVWSWLHPECWQVCWEDFMWLQPHQRPVLSGTEGRLHEYQQQCWTLCAPLTEFFSNISKVWDSDDAVQRVCVSQPGEEFFVDDCKLKCRCDVPFVTCAASECPPLHECKLQGGVLGCYPTSKFTEMFKFRKTVSELLSLLCSPTVWCSSLSQAFRTVWSLEILITTPSTTSSTALWEHVPTHWPEPAGTTQVTTQAYPYMYSLGHRHLHSYTYLLLK